MKKIYVILFSLICLAHGINASIAVSWGNTSGAIKESDGDSIPIGSLALLIWTGPDGQIDSLNPENPTAATDDDVIIAQTTVVASPGFLTPVTANANAEDAPYNLTEDDFVAGRVYVRVFNSGTPGAGTEYGDSTLSDPLTDQDPGPATPDSFDITAAGGMFTLSQVIAIPEPSSAIMVILGAFVAVWRKKRLESKQSPHPAGWP